MAFGGVGIGNNSKYLDRFNKNKKLLNKTRHAAPSRPPVVGSSMQSSLAQSLPQDAADAKAEGANQEISLNFENTSIKSVVEYLSKLTGLNFIIDKKLSGTVTIISPKKIPREDAIKVMETILDINGFALVPTTSESVISVIPKNEAHSSSLIPRMLNSESELSNKDRVITRLITIEYAALNDISTFIKPLLSKEAAGTLSSYGPANLLILTDTEASIKRVMALIEQIDIPTAEEKITVFHIEHANAKTMTSIIQALIIVGKGGTKQARKGRPAVRSRRSRSKAPSNVNISSGNAPVFKIIADERINILLVLADEGTTEKVRELIAILDQEAPTGRDNINVYYLEYADAVDLAAVLNRIDISETEAKVTDHPGSKKTTRVPPKKSGKGKANIVADKNTNALIIIDTPENYATYKKVIQQLDIQRPQVLVEALIAEVSLDKTMELGVDWSSLNTPRDGVVTGFAALNGGIAMGAMSGTLPGLSLGLMKGTNSMGLPNIGTIINTYRNDADFNILSTPHLVTLDNQEAEIVIANNIPFVKNSRVTIDQTVVKTFDYKDVGITLRITPHINVNENIRMEIYQEISQVMESSASIEAPTTTRRHAKTNVVVQNNSTIVIGGLISENQVEVVSKVPILGDIPILGYLFKRTKTVSRKNNLLIFITPHIIRNAADYDALTSSKQQQMDAFKLNIEK